MWRTFLGWAYLAEKHALFGPLIVAMKNTKATKQFNFTRWSDMGEEFFDEMGV